VKKIIGFCEKHEWTEFFQEGNDLPKCQKCNSNTDSFICLACSKEHLNHSIRIQFTHICSSCGNQRKRIGLFLRHKEYTITKLPEDQEEKTTHQRI